MKKLRGAIENVRSKAAALGTNARAEASEALDNEKNEERVAGAEARTSEILAVYKRLVKADKAHAEKALLFGKCWGAAASSIELQGLKEGPTQEVLPKFAEAEGRAAQGEVELMNEGVHGLCLFLEDYVNKKLQLVKVARKKYDKAFADYAVAAQKLRLRQGKTVETTNVPKYIAAATELEGQKAFYEETLNELLRLHEGIEEEFHLDIVVELMRAHSAHVKLAQRTLDDLEALQVHIARVENWCVGQEAEHAEWLREHERKVEARCALESRTQFDALVRVVSNPRLPVLRVVFEMRGESERIPSFADSLVQVMDDWAASGDFIRYLIVHAARSHEDVLFKTSPCEAVMMEAYLRKHAPSAIQPHAQQFIEKLISSDLDVMKPEALLALLGDVTSMLVGFLEKAHLASPLLRHMCNACAAASPTEKYGVVASLLVGRLLNTFFNEQQLKGRPRVALDALMYIFGHTARSKPVRAVDVAQTQGVNMSAVHAVNTAIDGVAQWSQDTEPLLRKWFDSMQTEEPIQFRPAPAPDGDALLAVAKYLRNNFAAISARLLEEERLEDLAKYGDAIARLERGVSETKLEGPRSATPSPTIERGRRISREYQHRSRSPRVLTKPKPLPRTSRGPPVIGGGGGDEDEREQEDGGESAESSSSSSSSSEEEMIQVQAPTPPLRKKHSAPGPPSVKKQAPTPPPKKKANSSSPPASGGGGRGRGRGRGKGRKL